LVVLVVMALLPASAAAQRCSGEDVAAVDQYCEMIPDADGNMPVGAPTQHLRDTLPPPTRRRLLAGGPDGRTLLALPLGAPMAPATRAVEPLPGAADVLSGLLGEHPRSIGAARAVRTVADSGNGLSDAFRWALLLSMLGLAGVAWGRQRR
jgi:hypothetical protein